MQTLEVTPAELAGHAATVRQASKGIEEALDRLNQTVTSLASQWTGDAQRAFQAKVASVMGDLHHHAGLAARIAAEVETLSGEYARTDADAAKNILFG